MSKPKALLVDIDGTLAHNTGRGWYDYDQVHTDRLDEIIHDLCQRYKDDHAIIIVTGRSESSRQLTVEWFKQHEIPATALYMRKDEDKRQDAVVKQEIYEEHIEDRYEVTFVLEDRQQCVDMWRELGLKCLQVEPGDF